MANYKPDKTTANVGKEVERKEKKASEADDDGSVYSSTAKSSSEFLVEESASISVTNKPLSSSKEIMNTLLNIDQIHNHQREYSSPEICAYYEDRCVSKRISPPSSEPSGGGMQVNEARPWGQIFAPPLHAASASTTTARSRSFGNRKRIRFSTVEIRQYDMCVGDNPSVTKGVPITITWTYSKDSPKVIGINEYERSRRAFRRAYSDLKISPADRQELLEKEFGISPEEIQTGQRNVQKTQAKREWTKKTLVLEPIQTALEYSFRAIANSTVRRRSRRKQKKALLVVQ